MKRRSRWEPLSTVDIPSSSIERVTVFTPSELSKASDLSAAHASSLSRAESVVRRLSAIVQQRDHSVIAAATKDPAQALMLNIRIIKTYIGNGAPEYFDFTVEHGCTLLEFSKCAE